eukprot:gnl/TRDRNA2_/TRDRNA2_130517_c0_seq4.p1 gnl/TRDRNA2_/TRDRNA2_130517_c0~~gnl/TRDRNA2_/TRDRNA2_130517_c0_seq4.p1  ORF type:complete len:635 (+),score=146.52 gnl/TRDRNA2_/TRDRNA2_130517_c0_seq4:198-2102(+)
MTVLTAADVPAGTEENNELAARLSKRKQEVDSKGKQFTNDPVQGMATAAGDRDAEAAAEEPPADDTGPASEPEPKSAAATSPAAGPMYFSLLDDDDDADEAVTETRCVSRDLLFEAAEDVDGVLRMATQAKRRRCGPGLMVHAAWLICGLGLAAAGCWWGQKRAARSHLEALEAKLMMLEEMAKRSVAAPSSDAESGTISMPPTGIDASGVSAPPSGGGNSVVSASATEIGRNASASSHRGDGAGDLGTAAASSQCDKGACTSESEAPASPPQLQQTQRSMPPPRQPALEAAPASAMVSEGTTGQPKPEAPLQPRPQSPSPPKAPPLTPPVSEGVAKSKTGASARPSSPFSKASGPPTASSVMAMSAPANSAKMRKDGNDGFPELTCADSPYQEWRDVKVLMWQVLGTWKTGVVAQEPESIDNLLTTSVEKLRVVHDKVNECGMGRLCMSVLAVLSGEAGRSLLGASANLHSPLLTLLLDVPWMIVMRSGWPFFAMLAQLHLGAHSSDDLPTNGLSLEAEYFQRLVDGLRQGEEATLAALGLVFIQQDNQRKARHNQGDAGDLHAMPLLCALASQLLSPDVSAGKAIEGVMNQVQGFFRQAVQSVDDLQATLLSAWPLYGVLHVAALRVSNLPP